MKEKVGKISKSNEFVVKNAIYFISVNYILIIGAFGFSVWQRSQIRKNQEIIKSGVYFQISTDAENKQKTDSLAAIKQAAQELKNMIP